MIRGSSTLVHRPGFGEPESPALVHRPDFGEPESPALVRRPDFGESESPVLVCRPGFGEPESHALVRRLCVGEQVVLVEYGRKHMTIVIEIIGMVCMCWSWINNVLLGCEFDLSRSVVSLYFN